MRFCNTWITEQSYVDFSSDSKMILCQCSYTSCHLKKQSFFHILHSINFRSDTFSKLYYKLIFIHLLFDFYHFLSFFLSNLQINVFFFLSYYLCYINIWIKVQIFNKLIFWHLFWKNYTLNFYNISWLSSVNKTAAELHMSCFWNSTSFQLFWSLLYFHLLERSEFRMCG